MKNTLYQVITHRSSSSTKGLYESLSSPKANVKRWVFKWDLNTSKDGACRIWSGRLFHNLGATTINALSQWFSNFLHQVPPQKIFGFPSTTIMTNIKMQYKWLPTAPGVCVCVCVHCCVCVCTLDGLNAEHTFRVCHVTFTFSSTIHSKIIFFFFLNESVLILIRIFIIVSLLKYSKYIVWTWTLHCAYFHVNTKHNY